MLKNYDEDYLMAKMLLLFNACFISVTGLYIIFTEDIQRDSTTYTAMSTLTPLKIWGIIFLIVGILYFFAAFHEGKSKYVLYIIAGTVGAVIFSLYAMASIEMTDNVMIGARYGIVGIFSLFIAVIGGYKLWNLMKK